MEYSQASLTESQHFALRCVALCRGRSDQKIHSLPTSNLTTTALITLMLKNKVCKVIKYCRRKESRYSPESILPQPKIKSFLSCTNQTIKSQEWLCVKKPCTTKLLNRPEGRVAKVIIMVTSQWYGDDTSKQIIPSSTWELKTTSPFMSCSQNGPQGSV